MMGLRSSAALALLAAPWVGAALADEIDWRRDFAGADVVVLGEVHDNPAHHGNQAAAVAAIAPEALVFEMLTPEQALRVTPENRGDAAALGAALGWAEAGWPDFAMYHPIFAAAPEARIYGAAFPIAEVRAAMRSGAAAAFGADAARYGLDQPLADDDRARREAEQAEAHCDALPAEMLPGMVEAQRLRDAGIARAAVDAVTATGGPVVVIAGTGHARTDRGAPALVRLAAPEITVIALGQLEATPATPPPFDLWVVTDPAPRPDPCAAFR